MEEVVVVKSKKQIIAELQEQVVKLTKEVESAKSSSKYTSDQNIRLSAEIEQMHSLFDTLEGCVGRKSNHEDSWARVDLSLAIRFSSWLAYRAVK